MIQKKIGYVRLNNSSIEAAANEANSRGLKGKYVIALKNTSGQPAMASLKNRSLREKIHKTSLSRGSNGGDFDNRENLSKVIKLRADRAQLMGYKNHAAYSLESQTAQTPEAVNERLSSFSWLERRPVKPEVASSSLVGPASENR